MQLFNKIQHYFSHDLWHTSMEDMPKRKAGLVHSLRILALSIRGYLEDKAGLRASALTFFTLLSIVPVLAMVFGIAKGFGMKQVLQNQLQGSLEGHEEVFNYIVTFADSMLENTRGGWMAGIGIVILLWSVFKILWNIEVSFNHIWQIKKQRTIVRKLSDYLSIIIIAPLFIMLSGSTNIFITTQLSRLTHEMNLLESLGPVILFLLKFSPYVMIWLLLTLLYMVMPNTNVKFKSALIAGVVAGTVFQLVQEAYIYFQVGVSSYNAIYGSFAAFPLFIVFLQIGWMIVLFGAEISFAHQNVYQYEFEEDIKTISFYDRKLACLTVMHSIVKAFEKGDNPLSAKDIAVQYKSPIKLIQQIIDDLVGSKLIVETQEGDDKAFVPATDINKIDINFVVSALNDRGGGDIRIKKSEPLASFNRKLETLRKERKLSKANVMVKDIVED
ncbi:YihY/virulence factor BrkB family protein [Bacteroidota bacterium]